jgi:predicted DNA-binding transcriptional regulator AlpA
MAGLQRRKLASAEARFCFGPPSTLIEEGRMAKGKKPTSLSLDDVVSVKDEPRNPVRTITLEEAAERLKVSKPTILKYERLGQLPRAREICGCTRFIEHEFDAAVTSSPIRKLKGDAA